MFLAIVDKHAPLKEKRVQKMAEHDHYKDIGDEDNYRQTRNRVNNMIKLSKTKYYITLAEIKLGNSKKLWSYLRELVPKCVKHVSSSLIDGVKKLTDPQEIANKVNDFFTSIVLKYIPDHQNEEISNNDHLLLSNFIQTNIAPSTKFSIPPIQEERVHELLADLDEHKITGLDGVSAKFLRLALPVITR